MGTLNSTPEQSMGIIANRTGLTLVELMIAVVLFSIVIAAIYQTFFYQQETYMQTEARVDMVQEARAAQFFLARDLKMAGYDPTTFARTGFDIADTGEVSFTMDIQGDADPANVESGRFALTSAASNAIVFSDGICPQGRDCRLSREWCDVGCGGLQPVAEYLEAIEFCYTVGNVRATTTPDALERDQITSVIVSMLFKQPYRSRGFSNTNIYMPASGNEELTPDFRGDRSKGWGPFNDPYRRKLVVFEVKSRNIGMNPYTDF